MSGARYQTTIRPLERVALCPACGAGLKADLSWTGSPPISSAEALSICVHCRSVLWFNGHQLERLSPAAEHVARLWHPGIRFWLAVIEELDHASREEPTTRH